MPWPRSSRGGRDASIDPGRVADPCSFLRAVRLPPRLAAVSRYYPGCTLPHRSRARPDPEGRPITPSMPATGGAHNRAHSVVAQFESCCALRSSRAAISVIVH